MPSFQNPDGSFFEEATGDPIMVVAPLTGATVTIPQNTRSLYINNAAGLAALTIKLPRVPPKGQTDNTVNIGFRSAVTAVTWQDASGVAVTGPSTGTINAAPIFRWVDSTVNSWVWWK